MELSQFISDTLINIKDGLSTANKKIRENEQKTYVMNAGDEILFDIAVTVGEENNSNINAGIKVISIGIGSDLEAKSVSGSISRIKFAVKNNFNEAG